MSKVASLVHQHYKTHYVRLCFEIIASFLHLNSRSKKQFSDIVEDLLAFVITIRLQDDSTPLPVLIVLTISVKICCAGDIPEAR